MNTELQSRHISEVEAISLLDSPGKVSTLRITPCHLAWCVDLINLIYPLLLKGKQLFRIDTRELGDYPEARIAALHNGFDNLGPETNLIILDSPRELLNDPGCAREVAEVDILIERLAKESKRHVLLIKYTS